MKKIVIGIVVLVVLGVAYWLIAPLWNNVALDEALPGGADQALIKDSLEDMDPATKAEFEAQTNEMSQMVMEKTEAMPTDQVTVISRGAMVARAHEVEGEALFVKSGQDTFLRFENLKTINGPDLRIYLAADLSADDVVDLGEIRATEGNVNYAIPAGTDLNKYKYVMIWCRAFSVLFSYAQL